MALQVRGGRGVVLGKIVHAPIVGVQSHVSLEMHFVKMRQSPTTCSHRRSGKMLGVAEAPVLAALAEVHVKVILAAAAMAHDKDSLAAAIVLRDQTIRPGGLSQTR
jgi:hypothetical protein